MAKQPPAGLVTDLAKAFFDLMFATQAPWKRAFLRFQFQPTQLGSNASYIAQSYLRKLGLFSDAELLAMWTGSTARTIFPKRRIGEFAEGCEASFVALEDDPLSDWSNTQKIRVRFKQGSVLPGWQ